MGGVRELELNELRQRVTLSSVPKPSKTIKKEIIGQDRARRGLEHFFAVERFNPDADTTEYNCYISAYPDVHSLQDSDNALIDSFKTEAKRGETPPEQLLVYDFDSTSRRNSHQVIQMEAGAGEAFTALFQRNMRLLIDSYNEVKEKAKGSIKEEWTGYLNEFNEKVASEELVIKEEAIEESAKLFIESLGKNRSFNIGLTSDENLTFEEMETKVNLKMEVPLCRESYDQLMEEGQELYLKFKNINYLEPAKKYVNDFLEAMVNLFASKEHLSEEREEDEPTPLQKFFMQLEEHLPQELEYLTLLDQLSKIPQVTPDAKHQEHVLRSVATKYQINHLVKNEDKAGRPVIVAKKHSYDDIFGTALGAQFSEFGQMHIEQNLTHLDYEAGYIFQANGGYLFLNAEEILMQPGLFFQILETIEEKTAQIDAHGNLSAAVQSKYRSVPLQANTRIVFYGDEYLGSALREYIPEFKHLFKCSAQFERSLETNKRTLKKYAELVSTILQERAPKKKFSKDGVEAVLEAGMRETETQKRIIADTSFIEDLVIKSALEEEYGFGSSKTKDTITREHVTSALEEQRYIKGRLEDAISEHIQDGSSRIDFTGSKVGEINGLVVYVVEDMFGSPEKITVRTYLGEGTLRNVDNNANLGGKILKKGGEILESLIKGELSDKNLPFPITAGIVFEQSYGGIDGDSASLAQYVGLISALTGIPVKQNGAITGSVNQYGDAQVIGGVNAKIEGHYRECEKFSDGFENCPDDYYFTVIPEKNKQNLMLSEKVLESVKDGHYKIFSVNSAREACEVMMGKSWKQISRKLNSSIKKYVKQAKKQKDLLKGTETKVSSSPKTKKKSYLVDDHRILNVLTHADDLRKNYQQRY